MDTCILRPPNSQFLSDEVIGDVVLRAKQTKRDGVANINTRFATADSRWPSGTLEDAIGRGDPPTGKERKTRLALKEGASVNESEVVKQILYEKRRLREMRRMRQIRYRKKKENYATTLEEEAQELRKEIEKLQTRRWSPSPSIPAKESVWSVVTEYFRLFRYGLQSKATTCLPVTNESFVQQNFLRNTMAADVTFNARSGPESITRSWTCLSMWFQDVELELEDVHTGAAGSLITITTTSVTITERTLHNVFPHLPRGEEETLAKKLRNQRIAMRGITRFEWDAAYARVKGIFSQADMLTPMLLLLGSLEDVSRVFERALISPDFKWRSDSF